VQPFAAGLAPPAAAIWFFGLCHQFIVWWIPAGDRALSCPQSLRQKEQAFLTSGRGDGYRSEGGVECVFLWFLLQVFAGGLNKENRFISRARLDFVGS